MRTCFASACAAIVAFACCTSAISYAFGAGAPPPAGAAPAAFSSAAFTEWPLNVRVGANSPSLCPTICSVTYTGMNFRPLCTAIVCPMKSGTIVERRDHVFTTFFSLRVFSPSTFTRRWPSTNGPFFSERAIDSLFLHAPQAHPLRSPHLLKSAHRTRNSVRSWAEGAYEARTLRIRNAFHDYRPTVLAQLVQHRLQRSRYNFYCSHRLCYRFRCRGSLRRCTLRCPLRGRPPRCPPRRTSLCNS